MSSAGVHKPPVAPKPKQLLSQGMVSSSSCSRTDNPSRLAPGMGLPMKVKPPVAPKPCLKPSAAVEPRSQSSERLRENSDSETVQTNGLLNIQNGTEQSKKTKWDYIIPICLCKQENCTCSSSTKFEQKEKNFKTPNGKTVPFSLGKQDNSQGKLGNVWCQVTNNASTNGFIVHPKFQERFTVSVDSETTSPENTSEPSLPHRTQSFCTDAVLQGVPGGRRQSDDFGSKQTNVLQNKLVPGPIVKAPPVPVPRKPKASVQSHQETVEEEETPVQEKREMSIVSLNGKGSSSPPVEVPDGENRRPVYLSARKACPPPAPMPRKKSLPSDTIQEPTSSTQEPSEDWQCPRMQDLNTKPCEIQESTNKTNEERQKNVRGNLEDISLHPSGTVLSQTELTMTPVVTLAPEESETGQASQKKHRRHSILSLIQLNESVQEKDGDKSQNIKTRQVSAVHSDKLKEIMTRELPSPPVEPTTGSFKHSCSSSKKKSTSFSSTDFLCADGQKGTIRKILDLKLYKKKKTVEKGEANPYHKAIDGKESTDKNRDTYQPFSEHSGAKGVFSSPLTGIEQSVDGDEYTAVHEEPVYDNVFLYEEISDYENVLVGKLKSSPPPASYTKPRPSPVYDPENIYEDQEPYFSLVKNAHLIPPPREFDGNSFDEEVAVQNDTFSGDDTSNTSDEDEDDSSSVSSKNDPEHPEQGMMQSETKKSNIQYIATEIMSSESVFVDVLKLLHVDFRESVNKASVQSGKPVIEDHLLNQILYYLPQLYVLNQNLFKELEQRVAQWDEHSQVADIFLKNGPFLKMYSTYIREFDKNVALLEDQSKKNAAFGAVVKEFEASPRCANLALKHYLLKPVQRIPQYQLLLTDYLKNLSEDSNDYKDTKAALALVKEVANHANDIIKHGDNFQKLMQVQCSLTGNHEIVQPGRIFLKEGFLTKRSRKVMQPRMFFLFNDALLYAIPVQSGQFKLKNMLSLSGMRVSKPSLEAYQNELNIESVERSFILSASSSTERDEWLETISTAIMEYTKKKISFIAVSPNEVQMVNINDGAPLGSKAPIWIPDLRTTMCMICTSEFTLTWRRHHCRACGKVVCQVCSSNKCRLAYLKNQQPARVCDQCFETLLRQRSAINSATPVTPGSKASFVFNRRQKRIPAALKEVSANTGTSSMSGYLTRSKLNKKQSKRLWFVIKDKVLYTYAASEDVAALESQPLLGFMLKADSVLKTQFKLYHQDKLYYVFKADDVQTAQRWINSFKEATVL
ncbi:FYVE, RhoGEF and PH domain-containing protein 6 isoform X2 [Austrofundulus limnaeus]|uniref:FYVE, RhoGEF and PH domain-containing protein 6 isoform X2 n=1 Tax=Austrofundulus limnaeus TaxID=52670 RepID=A0A2I4BXW9_AUSLI|nr:PREDICTED: FYVE, RhoGEF and PH domain-containing protein 6-like isoform X2 [Austrofundulus limnaeus]